MEETPRVTIKIDEKIDEKTPRPGAYPGMVKSGAGRRVEFYNDTGGEVTIVVVKHPQLNVTLAPQHTGSLNFSSVNDGEYVYAAYCKDGDDFAEGSSSPKVIIP